MKKYGGKIENWQMHTVSDKPEDVARAAQMYDDFEMDKVMAFTGNVVDDPLGRWEKGWHMRSSLVFSHNKETGEVETMNTRYTLIGEEGGDVFGDMGPAVMKIFY